MRVLLVEDEQYLAEAVQHLLRRSGYEVDLAADGEIGLGYARNDVYDVIILDNMLPKMSGIEILRALRREGYETPVLMLSAKSEVIDKVQGLEVGADDYLGKPFKTDELIARIRAITRRHSHAQNDHIIIGDLMISIKDKSVSCNAKRTELTDKEYQILEMLASHAGKPLHTEALFRRAWGSEIFVEPKYVSVYISYIRSKLNSIGSTSQIKATRHIGYRLTTGDKNV